MSIKTTKNEYKRTYKIKKQMNKIILNLKKTIYKKL